MKTFYQSLILDRTNNDVVKIFGLKTTWEQSQHQAENFSNFRFPGDRYKIKVQALEVKEK